MKKAQLFLLLTIVVAFLVVGAIYSQKAIGDKMELANVQRLLETQPKIMPDMELPKLGTMPKFEGIAGWVNSGGLSQDDLNNKVVLVDFMTYSCINCIRTFPYLNQWWDKYKDSGLLIVGMHTPEFEFEKDIEEVRRAMREYDIKFPVALDNDYKTWRNFSNIYWPATYIFDREGNLRYTHFGEGEYDVTESAIQQLLGLDEDFVKGEKVDFNKVNSDETYFGWGRAERFDGPVKLDEDERTIYEYPQSLPLNHWALDGSWLVTKQYSEIIDGPSKIKFRFNDGTVNFVMGTTDKKQRKVNVYLDGEPIPRHFAGTDVEINPDGSSFTTIEYNQLYELYNGPVEPHTLELEFLDGGAQVYSVTFGD